MKQHFSDELLNAYLDNQLDTLERFRIMEALPHDKALSERLCRLQKVKDMVQLAYHLDTIEPSTKTSRRHTSYWPALAASVLLLLGLATGWFAHRQFNPNPSLTELAQSIQLQQGAYSQNGEWRLILHINSGDTRRFNTILDETERLLKTSAGKKQHVKVEILTNGPGLNLLKESDAAYIRRLQKLTSEYDNLTLLACNKAIQRLKVEKGIDIKLIPEVKVVESAIHQVIKRQKEGWSYLRI